MIAIALKGLAGRKLRSALTALAIVLGVAMVSGTFVLTDTIKKGFDTVFTESYKNTDAVVTSRTLFEGDNGPAPTRGFPASLQRRIQGLPAVDVAAGNVQDDAQLVDRNGKVIQSGGAPNLAFSVDPASDQRFNPLALVSGEWPNGPDQVGIDKGTADKKHFRVGDTIGVATAGPERRFRITAIVKFGSLASIGGATIAVFDLPTAQKLFNKEGRLDTIRIKAAPGIGTPELMRAVRPLLPKTAVVRSSTAQAQEDNDTGGFIGFLQKFLLAFGGIALFVGSFVIANTLSITIAQRTRELATLRTLGASRRQVRRSIVLEALVVGVLASVAGLFLGLGLAKGLDSLMAAIGIDLPKSQTVFATRTIVVSLLIGIGVTLLASLRPAFRATRVPPIAAVREGSVLPPSRFSRFGPVAAIVVGGIGIALLAYGIFGHGLSVSVRLLSLGLGVLLLFLGVAMFAKQLVRPLAAVLGWPAARLGGAAGTLARDNAIRNPSRTASTASALMIGLALVTLVAILAQGLRSSFESAVDKLFHADYALTAQSNFTPLTNEAAQALRDVPGVTALSGIRAGSGRVLGKVVNVTGADRDLTKVVALDWKRGSSSVPAQLGRNGVFVSNKYADDHDLAIGSRVRLQTPYAKTLDLRVKGIFEEPKGGSPFGQVTISNATFDRYYPRPANLYAFLNVKGGVTPENTKRLESALGGFPNAKIADEEQFKRDQEQFLLNLLNLLYVLLGLSVIISLFGIVNTLVLTVFERTRELGMLRAVGMTRRQVRRMIRHESIVTSLIGGALGIVLGIFLAVLITRALSDEGIVFAVPYFSIVVFVIAAIVVGILAAIFPARRAARLNVLEALQYE